MREELHIGRDNCYDALRYVFALSLIASHYFILSGADFRWPVTGNMCVKCFFSLSGLLVAYSYMRRRHLANYWRKRLARILPAYVACIVFCLAIGAAATTLPWQQFWQQGQTWRYLVCNLLMLNWLQPDLPGVFANHAVTAMDGSLWTMKVEMLYYALVPLYLWCIARLGQRVVVLMVAALMALTYERLNIQLQYFCYFLSGSFALFYYHRLLRHRVPLAMVSTGLLLFIQYGQTPWVLQQLPLLQTPAAEWFLHQVYLYAFPVSIVTLGNTLRPLNVVNRYDDLSYGLFLYHFPIIQTLIMLFPALSGTASLLVVAIALTTVVAYLSRRFIEQPFLSHV